MDEMRGCLESYVSMGKYAIGEHPIDIKLPSKTKATPVVIPLIGKTISRIRVSSAETETNMAPLIVPVIRSSSDMVGPSKSKRHERLILLPGINAAKCLEKMHAIKAHVYQAVRVENKKSIMESVDSFFETLTEKLRERQSDEQQLVSKDEINNIEKSVQNPVNDISIIPYIAPSSLKSVRSDAEIGRRKAVRSAVSIDNEQVGSKMKKLKIVGKVRENEDKIDSIVSPANDSADRKVSLSSECIMKHIERIVESGPFPASLFRSNCFSQEERPSLAECKSMLDRMVDENKLKSSKGKQCTYYTALG